MIRNPADEEVDIFKLRPEKHEDGSASTQAKEEARRRPTSVRLETEDALGKRLEEEKLRNLERARKDDELAKIKAIRDAEAKERAKRDLEEKNRRKREQEEAKKKKLDDEQRVNIEAEEKERAHLAEILPQPLPSTLARARIIEDIGKVSYPEGIKAPSKKLNLNATSGKFR
jgi:translation initiation factor 4G